MEFNDQIVLGNSLDILAGMLEESKQVCCTSPPFYGMRQYEGEPIIWAPETDCIHEWAAVGGAPTKIAQYGSTETEKNPALVESMKECEHDWEERQKAQKGGLNQPDNPPNVRANKHIQDMDGIRGTGSSSSFCVKCGAWCGMLGLEPTPELYIQHLVQIFRQVWRVLRKDGTLWLNIGDTHASQGGPECQQTKWQIDGASNTMYSGKSRKPTRNLKPKDMIGIPWMLATALRNDGWWLRSTIIWRKINCMPSSAKDRPTTDFEYIFLLAKNGVDATFWTHRDGFGTRTKPAPDYRWFDKKLDLEWDTEPDLCRASDSGEKYNDWKSEKYTTPDGTQARRWKRYNLWAGHAYYYNADAIREPMSEATRARDNYKYSGAFKGQFKGAPDEKRWQEGRPIDNPQFFSSTGRNKRTVWEFMMDSDPYEFWKWLNHKIPKEQLTELVEDYARMKGETSFLDIPTKGFPGAHFAVWPEALVEPMILAGSAEKACPVCGAGWLPRKQKVGEFQRRYGKGNLEGSPYENQSSMQAIYEEKGLQPTCDCPANDGSGASVVLDPFAGAGTTCLVAKKKHRHWVGIDNSQKYVDMGEKRVAEAEPDADPDANQMRLF